MAVPAGKGRLFKVTLPQKAIGKDGKAVSAKVKTGSNENPNTRSNNFVIFKFIRNKYYLLKVAEELGNPATL